MKGLPGNLRLNPDAVRRVGVQNQQRAVQNLVDQVTGNMGEYPDMVCPGCGGLYFWQAHRMKKASRFDPAVSATGVQGDTVVHVAVWLCVSCKKEVSFLGLSPTAEERRAGA